MKNCLVFIGGVLRSVHSKQAATLRCPHADARPLQVEAKPNGRLHDREQEAATKQLVPELRSRLGMIQYPKQRYYEEQGPLTAMP